MAPRRPAEPCAISPARKNVLAHARRVVATLRERGQAREAEQLAFLLDEAESAT